MSRTATLIICRCHFATGEKNVTVIHPLFFAFSHRIALLTTFPLLFLSRPCLLCSSPEYTLTNVCVFGRNVVHFFDTDNEKLLTIHRRTWQFNDVFNLKNIQFPGEFIEWNSFSVFLPYFFVPVLLSSFSPFGECEWQHGCDKLKFNERNAFYVALDGRVGDRLAMGEKNTAYIRRRDKNAVQNNVADKLVTLFPSNCNQFVVCPAFSLSPTAGFLSFCHSSICQISNVRSMVTQSK